MQNKKINIQNLGQVLLKFLFGINYLKMKNLYDQASADTLNVFKVFEEVTGDEIVKDTAFRSLR